MDSSSGLDFPSLQNRFGSFTSRCIPSSSLVRGNKPLKSSHWETGNEGWWLGSHGGTSDDDDDDDGHDGGGGGSSSFPFADPDRRGRESQPLWERSLAGGGTTNVLSHQKNERRNNRAFGCTDRPTDPSTHRPTDRPTNGRTNGRREDTRRPTTWVFAPLKSYYAIVFLCENKHGSHREFTFRQAVGTPS